MTCIRVRDGILCVGTSYSASIDDAQARLKRGERQHYCFKTELWEWTTDCGCSPMLFTMRALERFMMELAEASKT